MKYTCKVLDPNLGKKNRPLLYKGIFQYCLTSFDTSDSLVPPRKLFLWLQMILSETRMWTANARSHVYKSSPLGLSGYLNYRIFETLSSKRGQPWILGCHNDLFFVAHAKLESILQEVSVLILWWIVSCCSNSAVPLIAGFQGRISGLLAGQSQASGLDSSHVI